MSHTPALLPHYPTRHTKKPRGMDNKAKMPVIPVYDRGGSVNVQDGKHQVAVLEDGERVLTPEETKQYERTHAPRRPTMSTRMPRIAPLYDNGGDVSKEASERLRSSGDANLQSFLNAPEEKQSHLLPLLLGTTTFLVLVS